MDKIGALGGLYVKGRDGCDDGRSQVLQNARVHHAAEEEEAPGGQTARCCAQPALSRRRQQLSDVVASGASVSGVCVALAGALSLIHPAAAIPCGVRNGRD